MSVPGVVSRRQIVEWTAVARFDLQDPELGSVACARIDEGRVKVHVPVRDEARTEPIEERRVHAGIPRFAPYPKCQEPGMNATGLPRERRSPMALRTRPGARPPAEGS